MNNPETKLKLLIVIVNFRTPELSIDCLRSLSNQVPKINQAQVIIVDNGSGDGSAEKIRETINQENWQSWVTLLAVEKNYGFAGGNNRGLEKFPNVDYALLLNSDTIVQENCLKYCLKIMDNDPTIGAMSCKLLNRDGSAQTTARKFPNPPRIIAYSLGLPWRFPKLFNWANMEDQTWDRQTEKRDVDWLGGAFLLVRGEVLKKIGFLDEDFFFYGEDIEFSYRIYKAGYRRYYDPTVSIIHFGAESSDPTRMAKARRQTLFWQARYLVQRKCYGILAAIMLRFVDIMFYGLRALLFRILGKQETEKYRESLEMWQLLSQSLNI